MDYDHHQHQNSWIDSFYLFKIFFLKRKVIELWKMFQLEHGVQSATKNQQLVV